MKATRANLLGEFTGHLDGLIYYRSKKNGKLYVRRRFKFKNHPAHPVFTKNIQNIYALSPSEGYKQNLKIYIALFNANLPEGKKPLHTWTNAYTTMMFALQKAFPETVNLGTLTRNQIYSQNLPCKSVKQAVEAGLLPLVETYELLSAEF